MEVQKVHLFENFCYAMSFITGKQEYAAGMKGILSAFQLIYSTAAKKNRQLAFSMMMRLIFPFLRRKKRMIGFDHSTAAVIGKVELVCTHVESPIS